jgi:hypothetical protein
MMGFLGILLLYFFPGDPDSIKPGQCDVAQIFQKVDIPENSRVLTMNGSFTTASLLLQPAPLENGKYEFSLTRRATNLYMVENSNLFIETKLCFNIGFQQSATVVIDNTDGYIKGTVTFQ